VFGTTSASSRFSTWKVTSAVMPGRSLRSLLSTETTAS
jgi:hypothetical protein